MNSFFSVIQRLHTIEQTATKLVLRELPVLDWAIAFALIIIGLILSIANFWVSAAITGVLAIYFIVQGRMRLIIFDAATHALIIQFQTLISKQGVSEYDLRDIQRAYLFKGDDAGTQIILVRMDGEEMGMSAYSNDVPAWKEDIVIAINAILHEAHKDNISDADV